MKTNTIKTKYNINVADCAEYQRVLAFFEAMPHRSTYYETCILNNVMRCDPAVIAARKKIAEDFDDAYGGCDIINDFVRFDVNKVFNSRKDLVTYFITHDLDLTQKVMKDGRIIDGKPFTQVIYAFTKDDIRFNLSYRREGFPTSHCKMVTNVTTSIACDVDGSDDNTDEEIPF